MHAKRAAIVAMCVVGAAGCGANAKEAAPSPPTSAVSTTITGYTQSQVLGWVGPTLDNGEAFVKAVPAGAPSARLVRAAQSLSTACSVARSELDQAAWTGSALAAETALSAVLSQTITLVGNPASSTFPTSLQGDIGAISSRLSALDQAAHT